MNGYRSATTGSIALALMAMSLSAGAASPRMMPASPVHTDQTNDQARKADIEQAKQDKAADKAQAKADKAEVKADKSHKVKKADKAQDKADAKADKVDPQ
jgi:hypothetical protein